MTKLHSFLALAVISATHLGCSAGSSQGEVQSVDNSATAQGLPHATDGTRLTWENIGRYCDTTDFSQWAQSKAQLSSECVCDATGMAPDGFELADFIQDACRVSPRERDGFIESRKTDGSLDCRYSLVSGGGTNLYGAPSYLYCRTQ